MVKAWSSACWRDSCHFHSKNKHSCRGKVKGAFTAWLSREVRGFVVYSCLPTRKRGGWDKRYRRNAVRNKAYRAEQGRYRRWRNAGSEKFGWEMGARSFTINWNKNKTEHSLVTSWIFWTQVHKAVDFNRGIAGSFKQGVSHCTSNATSW